MVGVWWMEHQVVYGDRAWMVECVYIVIVECVIITTVISRIWVCVRFSGSLAGQSVPECLLDVCDINHSGVEDYTPEYIQGISREDYCAKVDKAKGINSNQNSKFYYSQDNY